MIVRLKNSLIKKKTWLIYAQTGMGTKDTWNHTQTQSLHTHTKEVKAVSVDGSITSTRDDKRQFSSHHHMTLCMEDGWRSMDGERGRRVCVLGLKLAVIPPPRFCKDIQSTCKRTCVHITNICAQSDQHASFSLPLSIGWLVPFISNNYFYIWCRQLFIALCGDNEKHRVSKTKPNLYLFRN